KLRVGYLELSGQEKQAEKLVLSSVSSAKPEERSWAIERACLLALELKDPKRISETQKVLITEGVQPYAAEAIWAQLSGLMEAKQYPEAFKLAGDLLTMKNAPTRYKARARFSQAKILKMEFESQSMNARAERVATVIALKTEKLDKAQRAFQA